MAAATTKELLLTNQTEKPNHYTYLKEFRVEQCPSFLQHKCNQHRPFVCFNWHFMNQRRRRPIRRRDGTFNYSADNYCTKYDETTGVCEAGDDCPFLHRTAGDTERRYHLRYYKTCMCVHDTDSRGYCVKNGIHCAFAHGINDQRPPVYDIKELEAMATAEVTGENANGPNVLDKERSLMNEDPKWQDTNYVLANYKTEPCKRPPRLCRQGYACPQYHNSKDKRRSPRKYKYRSTPCPNVKHGEEWGEPANCDAGDACQYCHTRTEQQFHPEIYKSTKCNDVQQAGYCPRSVFCAFAHVEQEVAVRDIDGPPNALALGEIISNALPPADKKQTEYMLLQNGNAAESSESASTSSLGSNHSAHNKAPGAQLHAKTTLANPMSVAGQFPDFTPDLTKQLMAIENDPMLGPLEKEQRKRMCLTFSLRNLGVLDGVPASARFDAHNELQAHFNTCSDTLAARQNSVVAAAASMSGLLQGASAPVNIPGSNNTLANFSPGSQSNLFSVSSDPFNHSISGGSAPKLNNSFGPGDSFLFQQHLVSPGVGDNGLSLSPDFRGADLNASELTNGSGGGGGGSLFDKTGGGGFPMSPLLSSANGSLANGGGPLSELNRLREELVVKSSAVHAYEDQALAANKACDMWKLEMEESSRKAAMAERERDEAMSQVRSLQEQLEQCQLSTAAAKANELRGMPLAKLKGLQARLRTELEEVEKVLYLETATKCMKCESNNRSVTVNPCNHYVLCDACALTQRECPYCQTTITSQA